MRALPLGRCHIGILGNEMAFPCNSKMFRLVFMGGPMGPRGAHGVHGAMGCPMGSTVPMGPRGHGAHGPMRPMGPLVPWAPWGAWATWGAVGFIELRKMFRNAYFVTKSDVYLASQG